MAALSPSLREAGGSWWERRRSSRQRPHGEVRPILSHRSLEAIGGAPMLDIERVSCLTGHDVLDLTVHGSANSRSVRSAAPGDDRCTSGDPGVVPLTNSTGDEAH